MMVKHIRLASITLSLVSVSFFPVPSFSQNGNTVVVIPMEGDTVVRTKGSFYKDSNQPNFVIQRTPEHQSGHWTGIRFRIIPEPGGEGDNDGRLEVSLDGGSTFGTVCDDGFDQNNNAARVVCRSMGYSDGVLRDNQDVTDGSGAILIDDMLCPNEATTFFDCGINQLGTNNCLHIEDVGVTCIR